MSKIKWNGAEDVYKIDNTKPSHFVVGYQFNKISESFNSF